jgi:hypothetical protein
LTAASRLIELVTRDNSSTLSELARRSAITTQKLTAVREGKRTLQPDEQMRLAAVVVELAPAHRRAAYRLYGQAQAALRTLLEGERTHSNTPPGLFR